MAFWVHHIGKNVVIHSDGERYDSKSRFIQSNLFRNLIELFVERLEQQGGKLLSSTGFDLRCEGDREQLLQVLQRLCDRSLEDVARDLPSAASLLDQEKRIALHQFVERMYDFWRSFERFFLLHSEPGPDSFENHPYRAFNDTLEALEHKVRAQYRDICEHITGSHPRIYRQVAAGCNVGLIAVPKETGLPDVYRRSLGSIPFIRQVLIEPPMIIDPPMNKRTGEFLKVEKNPLDGLVFEAQHWICYPAQVGPLVVFAYFHHRFIDLGCALANLFELANDEQIASGPDAVFLYGVPTEGMRDFGDLPTVFCDDERSGLVVGAIPEEDRFGYFGYLKKMILTLHNAVMMKRGRMPFHGAMLRLSIADGKDTSVLIIGDTATGKSETLEALRAAGAGVISEMSIIADDMGTIEVSPDGALLGYGTEIGAFVRLDDLQPGYAFGQMDRAIIMSPGKVNARVVLPVTTIENVLCGYPLDVILYANNYEPVDANHPVIERFPSVCDALAVFREGAAMAKGTTTSEGLVRNYFANIFGPPQYRELHEVAATKVFEAAYRGGVFVGQLRTQLGLAGFEQLGPKLAAEALLDLVVEG
jgi:hypothetical protein